MITALGSLGVLSLVSLLLWILWRARFNQGRTKEKLNNAQQAIKNANTAKGSYARLSSSERKRLRERYDRE